MAARACYASVPGCALVACATARQRRRGAKAHHEDYVRAAVLIDGVHDHAPLSHRSGRHKCSHKIIRNCVELLPFLVCHGWSQQAVNIPASTLTEVVGNVSSTGYKHIRTSGSFKVSLEHGVQILTCSKSRVKVLGPAADVSPAPDEC
eukprot:680524-Prorocentrum_minimum.AAC.2